MQKLKSGEKRNRKASNHKNMSEKMFEPKFGDSFKEVPETQKDRFKPAENGGFVYAEALSKEEAEREAEKMQEKVEEELSPEIVEMIMAKVQDINKIGTPYKGIPEKKLESILKFGLLANPDHHSIQNPQELIKSWVKNTKEKKGVSFFNIVGPSTYSNNKVSAIKDNSFNPGQMTIIFDLSKFTAVGNPLESTYESPYNQKPNTFRYSEKGYLAPNKEIAKKNYEEYRKNLELDPLKRKADFRDNLEFNDETWYLFLPPVIYDYGFTLSYRVAPRFFKGIILKPEREMTKEEKKKETEKNKAETEQRIKRLTHERNILEENINSLKNLTPEEEKLLISLGKNKQDIEKQIISLMNDEKKLVDDIQRGEDTLERILKSNDYAMVEEIIQQKKVELAKKISDEVIKANKGKPKNLLPIYDFDGNLLWPKQMSYEEVKKFVAEKDKNKEE